MVSKWKGDYGHKLPAAQVEPYRLWFEFLKLALTDETLTVRLDRYEPWNDVANETFTDWWSAHWRELFAVDIGVHEVDRLEPLSKRSERELIIRIPLYQDPKRSLAQVKQLLAERGASDRLKDMAEGQYHLQIGSGENSSVHPSTRFLKNLPKVRLLLNIYRFWLSHSQLNERRRLEATATDYFKWADAWNRRVRAGKWNRPTIQIPGAIRSYVEYLNKREAAGRQRLAAVDDSSDNRRQIARYIRKARHIASNVAQGRFPGDYE